MPCPACAPTINLSYTPAVQASSRIRHDLYAGVEMAGVCPSASASPASWLYPSRTVAPSYSWRPSSNPANKIRHAANATGICDSAHRHPVLRTRPPRDRLTVTVWCLEKWPEMERLGACSFDARNIAMSVELQINQSISRFISVKRGSFHTRLVAPGNSA